MARQIQRWGYQYEGVDENGRPVGECIAVRDKNGQWVQWSDVAPMLEESRKTVRSAVQHVKPKMPSYKAFDEYCHSISVDGVQSAHLFRYFARHFGR